MERLTVQSVGALILLASVCAPGLGQARSAYVWRNPQLQGLQATGGNLAAYGTGVGGLASYSAPSANILSSTIAQQGSFDIPRPAGTAAGLGVAGSGLSGMSISPLTAARYQGPEVARPLTGSPAAGAAPGTDLQGIGAADVYLQAMQRASELATEADKPITTFVPSEPSLYQKRMSEADGYFRKGQYRDAVGTYEVVLPMARQLPEVHLSLAISQFATADFHSSLYHLKKALGQFPELPMVKLSLRGFYGEEFVGNLATRRDELAERLKNPEVDADLRLLLAFVDYFDGRTSEAVAALKEGYRVTKRYDEKETAEAMESFWDGLIALGKVKETIDGKPLPTTAPAPTTGPAGDAGPDRPPEKPDPAKRPGT